MALRIFILFISTTCISGYGKTLSIAAIDWCPQICPDAIKKGYTVDLVEKIYRNTNYKLDIKYYPWSRAISMVTSGKADALLAPAKKEAPDLIYPENEVGKQTMCFFTKNTSKWRYTGVESLNGLQVGIAQDTSIEELNPYVLAHPEQFQYQPYHERYIIQNAHKLDKKRIDTFLFTKNSTIYELSKLNEWIKYRNAGCVSQANIYLAFTPSIKKSGKVTKMIHIFDTKMNNLKKTTFITKLMTRYGLSKPTDK